MQWVPHYDCPSPEADEILVCKRFANGGRLVTTMIWWRGRETSAEWQEVTHWMPMPELPPCEQQEIRTMDKEQAVAINVKQEAADTYYEAFETLPDRIKKRLSLDMLAEVFHVMVVPAIDEVRRLDREHRAGDPCTCGPQEGCTKPCDRTEVRALRDAVAGLMYAGNRLEREAAELGTHRDDLIHAWHQAIEAATPEHAKPIVCRRED
jgi:hypothetical protein